MPNEEKMKLYKLVEKRNLWFSMSGLVILLGFVMMGIRGIQSKPVLNFGIDFRGGSTMILKFDQNITPSNTDHFIQSVRNVLQFYGLDNSSIQIAQDGQVIIKTLYINSDKVNAVQKLIQQKIGTFEVLEVDYIGPTIGAELQNKSIWIVLFVTVLLLIYITFRFDISYGIGVFAATLHDALVILSVASIFNLEVNTEFVAAILTILGYSINDTVVIFDRIRENFQKLKTGMDMATLTNESIIQTLGRTINTSVTTLIVITALFIFGGITIKSFCLILFVGILVGTYSSIFIAAPVLVMTHRESDPTLDA
jgi:preprotein translocase subunit SecF